MATMNKKLVSMTDRQFSFLRAKSLRTGAPVAKLIRMILDEHIDQQEFLQRRPDETH